MAITPSPTTTQLNTLLAQQGLTAAQAQQQFGLPPTSTNWMQNVGVQFATNPTQTSVAVSGNLAPKTVTAAPPVAAQTGTVKPMTATTAPVAAPVKPGTATTQTITAPVARTAAPVTTTPATAAQATALRAPTAAPVVAPKTTTALIGAAPPSPESW
jgi:hypothetical protein